MKDKFLIIIGCDTYGEGYSDIMNLPIIFKGQEVKDKDIKSYLVEVGYHNFHYQVIEGKQCRWLTHKIKMVTSHEMLERTSKNMKKLMED